MYSLNNGFNPISALEKMLYLSISVSSRLALDNLIYSFTNKEVTPSAGMVFMKQMLDKIGFRELITSCDFLPIQNSTRGHKVPILMESFLASIWCGANRFLHIEVTRSDKPILRMWFRYQTK